MLVLRITGIVLTGMVLACGAFAESASLQKELEAVAAKNDGRLGACILVSMGVVPACVNGSQLFPLQSVMKLLVAAAVLHAVDRGNCALEERIELSAGDISPGPREFARLITKKGSYISTVEELVRRSIVDSDSTAVDALIARLGGISAVQTFLKQKKMAHIRIDRTERELQAESAGLTWTAEFADLDKFEAALQSLETDRRNAAWNAHQIDPRDKASPEAMVHFLQLLVTGQLLSVSSTAKLLAIMEQTATGKDRLRAGIPPTWRVAHKTGTGRSWQGVTETTNDAGILTAPDGTQIAVAVFVSGSRASDKQQASVIADVARLVVNSAGQKAD